MSFSQVQTNSKNAQITAVLTINQAADAHRYVESGQKMGNVAITL